MSEAVTSQTIQQNTLKRVRKTRTQQKVLQNTFKPMRDQTQHIKDSAQGTNVTESTKNIRNSAKDTNQRNCQEDSYQTVRETLA